MATATKSGTKTTKAKKTPAPKPAARPAPAETPKWAAASARRVARILGLDPDVVAAAEPKLLDRAARQLARDAEKALGPAAAQSK